MLSVCDGELSAGAALSAIDAVLEQSGADETDDRAQTTQVLRELVADGFLVRDEAGGSPERE